MKHVEGRIPTPLFTQYRLVLPTLTPRLSLRSNSMEEKPPSKSSSTATTPNRQAAPGSPLKECMGSMDMPNGFKL